MQRGRKPENGQKLVRKLTGINLSAVRKSLLSWHRPKEGFGIYAGSPASCSCTALCAYVLARTGRLPESRWKSLAQNLFAFRARTSGGGGAFPRMPEGEPSTWTTGLATLALLALDVPWEEVEPSVRWLLQEQGASGGWTYSPESPEERLIYTIYPTLVLARTQLKLRNEGSAALDRVCHYLNICKERDEVFWTPAVHFLKRVSTLKADPGAKREPVDLADYVQIFAQQWPVERIDEDHLPRRFNMAAYAPSNYMFVRRLVGPTDPVSLLHMRCLADERLGDGWSDSPRDDRPKTWATALGLLTLASWSRDLEREQPSITRLPTRVEIVRSHDHQPSAPCPEGRRLLAKLQKIPTGQEGADNYRDWVRDIFVYLFSKDLEKPSTEVRTWLGTQRRDVTFAVKNHDSPWREWKRNYGVPASIVVECKNKAKLNPVDIRQLACYLGKKMGRFGIMVTRKSTIDDLRDHLNWFENNDDKCILVFNDDALKDWITMKARERDPTEAVVDLHRALAEASQ